MDLYCHTIKGLTAAAALGLSLQFTEQADAGLPDPPAVEQTDNDKPKHFRQIDLRTKSNADGSVYFLTFIARSGGAAGHAYVSFAKHDETNKMTSEAVHGLYPKDIKSDGTIPSDAEVVLGLIPQNIVNEYSKRDSIFSITHRMRFVVDKERYEAALQLAKNEEKKEDTYKLLINDCVSFVQRVGKAAKLDMPNRTQGLTPASYIEELINDYRSKPNFDWDNFEPQIKEVNGAPADRNLELFIQGTGRME